MRGHSVPCASRFLQLVNLGLCMTMLSMAPQTAGTIQAFVSRCERGYSRRKLSFSLTGAKFNGETPGTPTLGVAPPWCTGGGTYRDHHPRQTVAREDFEPSIHQKRASGFSNPPLSTTGRTVSRPSPAEPERDDASNPTFKTGRMVGSCAITASVACGRPVARERWEGRRRLDKVPTAAGKPAMNWLSNFVLPKTRAVRCFLPPGCSKFVDRPRVNSLIRQGSDSQSK